MLSFLLLVFIIVLTYAMKNKRKATWILAAYMWILFAFSYGNADYDSYANQFSYYAKYDFERTIYNGGYKLLCRLLYPTGMKYQTFLILEVTVALGLLTYIIVKYCKEPYLCMLMYCIYPYIIDTTQVRTFFAVSFLVTGIVIYAQRPSMKTYLAMAGFILLASSIHVSFFVYLILLLTPLLDKKYWVVIGILVFMISVGIVWNIDLITPVIRYGMNYLDKRISWKTVIGLIIYFISFYFPIYQMNNNVQNIYEKSCQETKFISTIFRINILMLAIVPWCFITNDFMRLYRAIIIINYMAVLNGNLTLKKAKIDSHKIAINLRAITVPDICLMVEIIVAIMSNILFISSLYWDTVVLPLFQNNLLIP